MTDHTSGNGEGTDIENPGEYVNEGVKEFLGGSTDGGEDRLPRRCPNDSARLEPKDGKPLTSECPECGYVSPRNLRGEEVKICHKKVSISENSTGEGEAYRAEVELGGIVQNVYLSREYVREAVSEDREEPYGGSDDDEPDIWNDANEADRRLLGGKEGER